MKNAYIGYSYQKRLTSLFLAKMDVERELDVIEIEADVNNDFDDLKIQSGSNEFYFQIKDINDASLSTLKLKGGSVFINNKKHSLSKSTNVIFFKHIDIIPDSEIFGMPAYRLGDVYIVSLSRESIDDRVRDLYNSDKQRESIVNRFFDACLDNRKLKIERKDLPSIPVFDTKLIEPTIDVGRKHLEVENILVIEGKPGVGKSHLVNCLVKEYPGSIIYRFWISSQDKDYSQRLKFSNFIFDFSKKLFNDQVFREEDKIIKKLWSVQNTVIIDGLDHVENYNGEELKKYIEFIQKLQKKCKTIVLTRPLRHKLNWKNHELGNWNKDQTRKVLDELFHIKDYDIFSKIFDITDGYPILVKYLAEHYKEHNSIPDINTLSSIDEYYSNIFENKIKTKSALTLFLCCRSFYTKSEIELFLNNELAVVVNEFINDYPYLFERRLNRVSLLHDSFNTYLRKQNIDYSQKLKAVNEIVSKSILNFEHRFLSRMNFFELDKRISKKIVVKYSSITAFETLLRGAIDIEAIQSFYTQLRECVAKLAPNDLTLEHYFELPLIINTVHRDHLSANNQFLFTYVKSLLFNGYSDDHITSSGYLFAMLYYIQTGNGELLLNQASNDFYGTDNFYHNLLDEVEEEAGFFNKHKSALSKEKIEKLLSRDTEQGFRERITFVLENLFIHENHQSNFVDLTTCIRSYVQSEDEEAVYFLENFLQEFDVRDFYARWILGDARKNLLALGYAQHTNEYLTLSLNELIIKYRQLGSFKLWVEILNYVRLSLHNNKAIDILSISLFWTKYYNRKDYSLISVPVALRIFEDRKFVDSDESINLITSIQEVSEKGYSGLLADYIELHSLDIVDHLINNYDINELHISWFTLEPKYINHFSEELFNTSMDKLLQYHRSSKEVDFREVENVINSNRCDRLRRILELTKFSVRAPKGSKQINALKKKKIPFREYADDSSKYRQNSKQRLNSGILTSRDKKMILEKKLKPEDVAGFSDGYYSTLADVDLFNMFSPNKIRKSIKPILHNAITGKGSSISLFHNLYYFPGNTVKLFRDYKIATDYKKLFKAFRKFLELAMFDLGTKGRKI